MVANHDHKQATDAVFYYSLAGAGRRKRVMAGCLLHVLGAEDTMDGAPEAHLSARMRHLGLGV